MSRDSDDAHISTAYRDLARRHHPDVAGEGATARMMRINAAFDSIRTAARRAALDDDGVAGPGGRGTRPGADGRGFSEAPDRDRTRWAPPNDGTGGAGPPPGRPSGAVLDFGRHIGWSIGEIARVDPGYLLWLDERREGRPYHAEIDATLKRLGWRPDREREPVGASGRGAKGPFRRR